MTTLTPSWNYLRPLNNPETVDAELVVIHHAGGARSEFRPWSRAVNGCRLLAFGFPSDGRSWDGLGASVADELLAGTTAPTVLFGHSLGALIAYEVALAMERRGAVPRHLVVSSRITPRQTVTWPLPDNDEDLLSAVAHQYGGIPKEILDEPELASLMARRLRSDLSMASAYRCTDQLLHCAVTAVAGEQDRVVTEAGMYAWRETTAGTFRSIRLPGDHFFLRQAGGLLPMIEELCR